MHSENRLHEPVGAAVFAGFHMEKKRTAKKPDTRFSVFSKYQHEHDILNTRSSAIAEAARVTE